MAARLHFAKRLLVQSSFPKLRTAFSTSSILKDEVDDLVHKKGEVIAIEPFHDRAKLPRVEERKLDDELVAEEEYIVSEVSGVPLDHIKERLVRIAKFPKNSMQSGTDNIHVWILQFDTRQRWENNLMGWISSGDPLSNLQLRFGTKEEAITFCKKNQYPYYVEKEKLMVPKKKSYAHNFSWNSRTRVSTK